MNKTNDYDYRTIAGTEANDSIGNYGNNVTINALGGNDTIQSYGDNSIVDAGTGNDFLGVRGSNVKADGGADDDTFYNLSSNSTLIGGTGNDVFYNNLLYNIITQGRFYYWEEKWGYGNNLLFLYKEGDGKDIIYGFKANCTLAVVSDKDADQTVYSTVKSGNSIFVKVGDGEVALAGTANFSKLNIITPILKNNSAGNTKLIGSNYNDTIINSGTNVSINASLGNDSISNKGNSVTIEGGIGNDYLHNSGTKVKLYGQTGDDFIHNEGNTVTIDGNEGNDTRVCW